MFQRGKGNNKTGRIKWGRGWEGKVKEDNEHPRPLKKEIWKPNTVEVS